MCSCFIVKVNTVNDCNSRLIVYQSHSPIQKDKENLASGLKEYNIQGYKTTFRIIEQNSLLYRAK